MFPGDEERLRRGLRTRRKNAVFRRRGLRSSGFTNSGKPQPALQQSPGRQQVSREMSACCPGGLHPGLLALELIIVYHDWATEMQR